MPTNRSRAQNNVLLGMISRIVWMIPLLGATGSVFAAQNCETLFNAHKATRQRAISALLGSDVENEREAGRKMQQTTPEMERLLREEAAVFASMNKRQIEDARRQKRKERQEYAQSDSSLAYLECMMDARLQDIASSERRDERPDTAAAPSATPPSATSPSATSPSETPPSETPPSETPPLGSPPATSPSGNTNRETRVQTGPDRLRLNNKYDCYALPCFQTGPQSYQKRCTDAQDYARRYCSRGDDAPGCQIGKDMVERNCGCLQACASAVCWKKNLNTGECIGARYR